MVEVITLKSDLTGTVDSPRDPVRAYPYEWEGEPLRIDLTTSEYVKWKEAMAPYLAASRPNPKSTTKTSSRGAGRLAQTEGAKAKRWANEHGAELSPRGPCPAEVLEAYKADDPEKLPHRNGQAARTSE